VLALHPDRLGVLLEEPGLVDDQHRARVAEVLQDVAAQIIPDLVRALPRENPRSRRGGSRVPSGPPDP
jgi:hypothetical protein